MTDVAGSTRLWETRAETMRAAIQRHDVIVKTAVEQNGGQLIKERGEGDSHFCVFTDPEQALRAAIAIQQRLPHEEWETTTPLVVRMSIHTAHAEPHGGDYYGRDVNRCARIRGAAHAGQILTSDTTRDSVQGFDFEDLGLHRLRDLSEQQRIYQLLDPEIPREFPPILSLNAVKHNLPVQLTNFIGREKELQELRKLAMGPRLISILGPGGAGKTRTALQLAAESIDQVKGGVWFVDLSPIQDGSTLTQKVIEDLHIRVGADEPDAAVAVHFQGEKTLLLLDNCEHVARDAAVFAEKLLKSAPGIYIIATSREPLGVSGERSYRLPPMNVKAEKVETLEDISHLDSVQLLMDRAQAKGYEEILQSANPRTILDLCKKLDGIPLALEQAAANLGVLSPETMLARLDERLSILTMDDEGVQARHRTLSAAIDWSYDALSEQERNLFLDLAVFSGGWTLQAAESICEQPKVLDLMNRLVNKSLVTPEATEKGDRRFRLLETMREYALEKRPTIPDVLSDRHLAYFSHIAVLAREAGLDIEDGRWQRTLDEDYSNITAALNRAISSSSQSVDGLIMAVALARYWIRRQFYREAGNYIQRSMDAAIEAPAELRADALNILGVFAWFQDRLQPAADAYQASLDIWQRIGNQAKVGAALNNLALLAMQREDDQSAIDLFEQAINSLEKAGDDARLAEALGNLGVMEARRGNFSRATSRLEKALQIHRRSIEREALALQMSNLLGLYAQAGQIMNHLDLLEEMIRIAREIGNPSVVAETLDVAAFVANENGDLDLAARLISVASRIAASVEIKSEPFSRDFRKKLEATIRSSISRQTFKVLEQKSKHLSSEEALNAAESFLQSV